MRAARKIRVHCPIARHTLVQLLEGDLAAIETDPSASKMLAIIRDHNALGDFDLYQGVFEMSVGVEGFTASEAAQPAAGERGRATLSPTAIFTTYIDAAVNSAEVSALIEALVRAHPWEVPVIELSDATVQLVRAR